MAEKWAIRPERPEDADQVEALDNDGFGPGRFAKTAYRLREGGKPESELSFVSVENAARVGWVRFWPIFMGALKALPLGPLAVRSALRGRGIGIALRKKGMGKAYLPD